MRRIGLVWVACGSLLAWLHAQRLIVPGYDGLGPFTGFGPMYLSPDGKVAVQDFYSRITGRPHPAIWTLQDGWWYLKRDGGLTRNPREAIWGGVRSVPSYDGSVVLGYDDAVNRSFRWRRGRGIEYLRRPPGAYRDSGKFLSWDGGWVGGRVAFPYWWGEVWWLARWSPEGRVELIDVYFHANDMSASGREMVGVYEYFWACHWREGEGLRLFWEPFTTANAVSADGTIAAGRFIDRNPRRFCTGRWFVDEERMECADPPQRITQVMDMSADGGMIVGWYEDRERGEGYGLFWEEGRGWVNIEEAYRWLFGENEVHYATGVSADGRFIVVMISSPSLVTEAILDRFGIQGDVTGDDCVDDADLLRLLFAFGEEGWRPEDVNVDRMVNEQDLLIVLSRFGECAN